MSKPPGGRLIVFEGGEGSGKTTQLNHAYRWLSSQLGSSSLVCTKEPGGTSLGQTLRQAVLSPDEFICPEAELLMYAADRAQHVRTFLRPHLHQGYWILCDRYTDSTIAYQGYGRGLDLNLIHQLNQITTDGLMSHLTFWLDLDVEVGLERARLRGVGDRMERDDLAFHQRVRTGFQLLYEHCPHPMVRIDASLGETQIANQIQASLKDHLFP
ncbi:MAG: dTMP kinase [Synechococcales bacterium]|nr:dTMP kinase [Cyanobacteria bacterium REEB444]MEB3125109.1 dTMP kinase [Synechococcales bacterium]